MSKINIPALSNDPRDTGAKYMVGHHRKMIAEYFKAVNEFPNGLENQRQFLTMLKATDPEKYNKAFDIIVRGLTDVEPQVVTKEIVPEEKITEIVEGAKAQIEIEVNKKINALSDTIDEVVGVITSEAKQFIKSEVEKHKIIKHVYEISKPPELKKVNGPLPECFQTVLDLANARVNILLVGPAGCGKTHLSRVVAESLNLDYAGQSCSAGMSESAFSGWLLPIGDAGKFEYVSSEFVRMYENGGVFLFDEIDAADSNTLLFLNQALANGEFFLPQRFNKPHVKRHKDFVAIGAANTMGNGATAMYSGRNILDGATMDRFRMGIVPMDYDPNVESEMVDPAVLKWGLAVRKIINEKNLRKIMSTRVMIEASKMKSVGWPIKKIHETYISDWSKDERHMLSQVVSLNLIIEE